MVQLRGDSVFATPRDLACCRELIRGGSRSFFAASVLLPVAVREPARALYAFCRLADDAIDLQEAPDLALDSLRRRLVRAAAGRPLPHAADRALADVMAQFAIPRALPEALLEGFAWDAAGRRYDTLAELHAYAVRVAGSVGAMMALIMDVRAPEVLARAVDLGVAMQLTNIARDVGEDARAGRIYLPLEWLAEAGIETDQWLAAPLFDARIACVVARLLRAADELYARAVPAIECLPRACRPAIHTAHLLYAEIGREVERRALDSVSQRAVVPAWRKAALMTRAVLTSLQPEPAGVFGAPMPEAQFLLAAVAEADRYTSDPRRVPRAGSFADRLVWTLDLFERLERRDRQSAAGELS